MEVTVCLDVTQLWKHLDGSKQLRICHGVIFFFLDCLNFVIEFLGLNEIVQNVAWKSILGISSMLWTPENPHPSRTAQTLNMYYATFQTEFCQSYLFCQKFCKWTWTSSWL